MDKAEFKFPDEVQDEPKKEVKAKEETDIEIEVVDDTPPEDKGRKPLEEPVNEVSDDDLAKYDESVQKRIKKITHGYHDERRAKEAALREREEALRFAQQVIDENAKLRQNLGQNTDVLVKAAKNTAELELEQARKKYKEAYESFDADQILVAQEALTTAKLKLDRLNTFKPQTLQTRQNPVNIQPQLAPEPQPDPKALAWRKDNQWFGVDEEMTSFALGLHEKLVKNGVDPTSDDYYERVNSRVREKFPENFEDAQKEEKPKRTSSNVVAPASRSVAPKKITLTQTQVALAKKLKIPLELYARKVAEGMTQNG
jgi:hypothetical protein